MLHRRNLLIGTAGMVVAPGALATEEPQWILDALETPWTSTLGTRWSTVTDRVMGGRSEVSADIEREAGSACYRMKGVVRTVNNGGFVQMTLSLRRRWRTLDAREFAGVRLRVRGNGETYALHLQTSANRLPWDFYSATFRADEQWTTVDLPFSTFERSTRPGSIDPRRLRRVALVGIGRDFLADVSLSSLSLYRKA